MQSGKEKVPFQLLSLPGVFQMVADALVGGCDDEQGKSNGKCLICMLGVLTYKHGALSCLPHLF